jgi:hypothetical protein
LIVYFNAKYRQVFGLAGLSADAVFLLSTASQPSGPVRFVGIVPAYRCGAAPEFHRIPLLFWIFLQNTDTTTIYWVIGPCVKQNIGV